MAKGSGPAHIYAISIMQYRMKDAQDGYYAIQK